MSDGQVRILAADDDPMMRQILIEYLEDSGYDLVVAEGGEEAWAILEKEGTTFDAVLLDRMMPNMDGMAVLSKIKATEHLGHIPVIMQTAAGSTAQVKEGLEAGAFYYLIKPFVQEVLLAIVQAAVRDSLRFQETQENLAAHGLSLDMLETGTFRMQTVAEVNALTIMLARACPNPEMVVIGLSELLINAVEHGNLGITYEEKTQLQQTGHLDEEMARRLTHPENMKKYAKVTFERLPGKIHITICDQGPGFDWKKYLELNMELACASHGRGIAMAKALSFDQVEFHGKGNEVLCVIHTQADTQSVSSVDVLTENPSCTQAVVAEQCP
jgi:DNA-binding response OmpR family regulator